MRTNQKNKRLVSFGLSLYFRIHNLPSFACFSFDKVPGERYICRCRNKEQTKKEQASSCFMHCLAYHTSLTSCSCCHPLPSFILPGRLLNSIYKKYRPYFGIKTKNTQNKEQVSPFLNSCLCIVMHFSPPTCLTLLFSICSTVYLGSMFFSIFFFLCLI